MGLMNLASGASLWRGYEYYTGKRVRDMASLSETSFEGIVEGNGRLYHVIIDVEHPRKSKCNCPHADGKRIICKHMIALYFTAFPKEADEYYNEIVRYEEEQERIQAELDTKVSDFINKLTKSQLKELVYDLLYSGPEWQFDKFVNENIEF